MYLATNHSGYSADFNNFFNKQEENDEKNKNGIKITNIISDT